MKGPPRLLAVVALVAGFAVGEGCRTYDRGCPDPSSRFTYLVTYEPAVLFEP